MDPLDLIRRDLGPGEWQRAGEAWTEASIIKLREDLSLFPHFKIYLVYGKTAQFDFPTLPHGSCGYYAANGSEALRLTRAGKEIERVLAIDWPSLPSANPVQLASFVLSFYDGGIKESHRVLAGAEELRAYETPPGEYRLDRAAFDRALPRIGLTSSEMEPETVVIRAVTLCGWMHRKGNLGIETLTISKDGVVALGPRLVLAENVFAKYPGIRY